jgi:hypothetical protein
MLTQVAALAPDMVSWEEPDGLHQVAQPRSNDGFQCLPYHTEQRDGPVYLGCVLWFPRLMDHHSG